MDSQQALRFAIAEAYPQILKKLTAAEFFVFYKTTDEIVCTSNIRRWIRDELIGEDSPLLRAFVECGYADRDNMTEYLLRGFKTYADNGTLIKNQTISYVFSDINGNSHAFPHVTRVREKI